MTTVHAACPHFAEEKQKIMPAENASWDFILLNEHQWKSMVILWQGGTKGALGNLI